RARLGQQRQQRRLVDRQGGLDLGRHHAGRGSPVKPVPAGRQHDPEAVQEGMQLEKGGGHQISPSSTSPLSSEISLPTVPAVPHSWFSPAKTPSLWDGFGGRKSPGPKFPSPKTVPFSPGFLEGFGACGTAGTAGTFS